MEKVKKVKDVRLLIAEHLEVKGIKSLWLAKKLGISPTHMHYILKADRPLTADNKKAINTLLQTNY